MQIPFNKPYFTGNEINYIEDLFNSIKNDETGSHLSGDGKYTHKAQDLMESRFNAKKVFLTTSGTSALELASYALDLKQGDEVIVPSYTFSSTVNAIVLSGATPVFADITPDTMNIDPDDIEKKITSATKAIYPVHYGGVACDMDRIMKIAKDNDLKVVEDAAQGVNAKFKDKYLGTIGDFGCYSFHETKNYSCGEGGALLVNTDDQDIIDRVEILREKGTDRTKFLQGIVDKYTWIDKGSSYLPSDILAAFLYAQLEQMDDIQEQRLSVWNTYYESFKPLEEKGIIRLPIIPDYANHNAHMFYVLFNDQETRNRAIANLRGKGIHSVFHYIPLHSAPFGLELGNEEGSLPVTEEYSGRLLRLPMYAGMNEKKSEHVISEIKSFLQKLKIYNL